MLCAVTGVTGMMRGNKKAGAAYRVIFRHPGCLSKTRGLSAPSSRMVKYSRLSPIFLHSYHFHEELSTIFETPATAFLPALFTGEAGLNGAPLWIDIFYSITE
jgi:hypothetical protein